MMCAICGCGAARVEQGDLHSPHQHHGHEHGHHHDHHGEHGRHDHWHGQGGSIHFGMGAGGVLLPGMSEERVIRLERDILSKNDAYAQANRERLRGADQFALNFVSSPGSGKTTLLVRAISDLKSRFPIAVVEGDQQTSNDAHRIRATGAPAIQINTGAGCHLDAHMVGHALEQLPLQPGGLLFIENVGNLVCPAAFDLGEAHKVVVLSVTEGEDKPLKYPDIFAQADLMLLNKADLLPHLDFDVQACIAFARRVHPQIGILTVSARTGEGMPAFYDWIEERVGKVTRDAGNVIRNAGCAPS